MLILMISLVKLVKKEVTAPPDVYVPFALMQQETVFTFPVAIASLALDVEQSKSNYMYTYQKSSGLQDCVGILILNV